MIGLEHRPPGGASAGGTEEIVQVSRFLGGRPQGKERGKGCSAWTHDSRGLSPAGLAFQCLLFASLDVLVAEFWGHRVRIHSLVIGVVGDAAFPRASARLCFWFPCLEGEEPRLNCTRCMRCVIYSKRERKAPAKAMQ